MVGALLSLIPTVLSLINSSKSSDEYQATIDEVKKNQRISPAMLRAQSVMAENATRGLAGYEGMKEDIYSALPTTMNQAKDWLTGAGAIDFLAKASAAQNADLRKLGYANEQQRQENERAYAGFLSGPMAGEQNRLSNTLTGLDMASANAGVYADAAQNNAWMSMASNLSTIPTSDLSNFIAGLSKNQTPTNDVLSPSIPKEVTFGDKPGQVSTYDAIINDLIKKGIFFKK